MYIPPLPVSQRLISCMLCTLQKKEQNGRHALSALSKPARKTSRQNQQRRNAMQERSQGTHAIYADSPDARQPQFGGDAKSTQRKRAKERECYVLHLHPYPCPYPYSHIHAIKTIQSQSSLRIPLHIPSLSHPRLTVPAVPKTNSQDASSSCSASSSARYPSSRCPRSLVSADCRCRSTAAPSCLVRAPSTTASAGSRGSGSGASCRGGRKARRGACGARE